MMKCPRLLVLTAYCNLVSVTLGSTFVVVTNINGRIVVGADSIDSVAAGEEVVKLGNACKIIQLGQAPLFAALSGHRNIVQEGVGIDNFDLMRQIPMVGLSDTDDVFNSFFQRLLNSKLGIILLRKMLVIGLQEFYKEFPEGRIMSVAVFGKFDKGLEADRHSYLNQFQPMGLLNREYNPATIFTLPNDIDVPAPQRMDIDTVDGVRSWLCAAAYAHRCRIGPPFTILEVPTSGNPQWLENKRVCPEIVIKPKNK